MPRFPFARCATHRGCRGERETRCSGDVRTIQRVQLPPPRLLLRHRISRTLLKQRTQAVNDRIPAKGCRHLLVKPWAHGRRKENTCQLCGAIINDKGEITGTSKSVDPEETGDRRGEASFQPDGGGTHGAGSGAGRGTRNQPVNEDRPEEAFAGRHQEDKRHVGKMV